MRDKEKENTKIGKESKMKGEKKEKIENRGGKGGKREKQKAKSKSLSEAFYICWNECQVPKETT